MRCARGVMIASALLGVAACKKNAGTAATGSGSTASESGSAAASAPPPMPAAPPAKASADAAAPSAALAAKALDDALAAQRIAADRVAGRVEQRTSLWALVKGTPNRGNGEPTAYLILRVTSAGAGTVELSPAPGSTRVWFQGVPAIDVKDIDGDGVDDALITATWWRQLTGKSKQGELTTDEQVGALYVIGGAQLAIGARHATSYKTETNLDPGENPQPEESIAFTYAIAPGPPAVLHVEVGASDIWPKRLHSLLDPRRDPWLTAADLPIAFK